MTPALLLALATQAFGPPVDTRSLETPGEPPIYYSISIPPDYKPSRPVPLILALHFGGDPEGAGRAVLEILVAPALKDLGAIIVAPDAKERGWSSPANEKAVNRLMDHVIQTFAIDPARIAVTGFSMGGAGTWYFGSKYPERFSAAIPVAGTPTAAAAGWKIPVVAIHSVDDTVVPIGPTRARIAELKKQGLRAEMVEVTGIAHHQTFRFVDALRQAVPWLREVWKDR